MGSVPRWKQILAQVKRQRRPKMGDLLAALDEINPTPHDLDPHEVEERYAAKSDVQTRLIALFGADLELRPDGETWILAVRGGRDAKHVVRHQLGESAQAWFSNELLRHHVALGDPHGAPSTPAAGALGFGVAQGAEEPADEIDAFLELGDYEGAVEHLSPRAVAGEARAAAQLLELLVDYLDDDAGALDHASRWPRGVIEHPAVVAQHALGLARAGQHEEAERRASSLDGPASARTWEELLRAYLRAGDHAAAGRAADRLEQADPGKVPVVDAARAELSAALAEALAGPVAALEEALAAGRWDRAEHVALEIVEREPGHRGARRALAVVEERRRDQAAQEAFARAEALAATARHADAASAFEAAAELGHPEAAARAREQRERAAAQARSQAIDAARVAVTQGDYAPYTALDASGCELVRAQITEPPACHVLRWIEACPAGRAAERISLALALTEAEAHLAAGRPAEALTGLGRVERSIARNRAARAVLAEAQARDAEIRSLEAQRALEAVEAALQGPNDQVRTLLDAVDTRWLDDSGRERHAEIEARAFARSVADERVRRFERYLVDRPMAAFRLARGEPDPDWAARAADAEAAVQRAFRVHRLTEPTPAGDLEVPSSWRSPSATLDLDARTVTLVDNAGRCCSVSTVDIDTAQVVSGLQFVTATPQHFRLHRLHCTGTAWLEGSDLALQVDLGSGRIVGEREPAPGSHGVRVVEAEPGLWWRGHRGARWTFEPHADGDAATHHRFRQVVAMRGSAGIVALTHDDVVVYCHGGDHLLNLARLEMVSLLAASVHPTDRTTVIVYERTPRELVISSIGRKGEVEDLFVRKVAKPRQVRGVSVGVARAAGCFFVLWPEPPEGFSLLVLDGEGGTIRTQAVPEPCSLVTDLGAQHCALVYTGGQGLAVHVLDAADVEIPGLAPPLGRPLADNFCEPALDTAVEEVAPYVEFDDGTLDTTVDEMVHEAGDDDARRESLVQAVASRFPRKGALLADRLGLGNRPRVALLVASGLVDEAQRPDQAARWMARVDETALPELWREHACHVRGRLALWKGDFDAARAAFQEGRARGASCDLARWEGFAELLDGAAPHAPPREGAAGVWQQARRALTTGLAKLAEGDPEEAWAAVETGPCSWLDADEAVMVRAHLALALGDAAEAHTWRRRRALGRAAFRVAPPAYLPEGLSDEAAATTEEGATRVLDG